MNCREAKIEMALHCGRDGITKSRWEEVRRHASTCVHCRVHYRRLKESMSILEQAEADCTYETRGTMWPALSAQLDAHQKRPHSRGTRSWLPYTSFAVACLLFVTVWTYQPNPPAANRAAPMMPRGGISSLPDFSNLQYKHHDSTKVSDDQPPVEATTDL